MCFRRRLACLVFGGLLASIYRLTGPQRSKKNLFLSCYCHCRDDKNDLAERDNFEDVEQVWKLVDACHPHEDRDVLEHDDLHLDVKDFGEECLDALGVVCDVGYLVSHVLVVAGKTRVYIEFFLDDKYGQGE